MMRLAFARPTFTEDIQDIVHFVGEVKNMKGSPVKKLTDHIEGLKEINSTASC